MNYGVSYWRTANSSVNLLFILARSSLVLAYSIEVCFNYLLCSVGNYLCSSFSSLFRRLNGSKVVEVNYVNGFK